MAANRRLSQTESGEDVPHPTLSLSQIFPDDRLLRANGWVIHRRRKDREAEWINSRGQIVPQSEALRRIRGKVKEMMG